MSSKTLEILQSVAELFARKNAAYDGGGSEFSNFTDNILVQAGKLNPYSYLFTLVNKHIDAMKYRVFENERFRAKWQEEMLERSKDCVVYFAILAAMIESGVGCQQEKSAQAELPAEPELPAESHDPLAYYRSRGCVELGEMLEVMVKRAVEARFSQSVKGS